MAGVDRIERDSPSVVIGYNIGHAKCNHERLHTSLQMQSPLEFEQAFTEQLLVA